MRPMSRFHRPAFLATTLAARPPRCRSARARGCRVLGGLDGSATAQQLNAPWQAQPMRPSAEILSRRRTGLPQGHPVQGGPATRPGRCARRGPPAAVLRRSDRRVGGVRRHLRGPRRVSQAGGAGSSGAGGPWPPIAADGLAIMTSGGAAAGSAGRAARRGSCGTRDRTRAADRRRYRRPDRGDDGERLVVGVVAGRTGLHGD